MGALAIRYASDVRRPQFDEEERRWVRGYVRRFSPEWLRREEEDLVQMVLVRVLRAGAAVDNRRAYLRQAARNTVFDEVRRRRYRVEVGMHTSLRDRITNSMDLTPETQVRGGEVGAEMEAAVEELCESRQAAVRLYMESLSVAEIAERLDQSHKQTANQLYRGLTDLRRVLASRGVTPHPI